MIFFIDLAIGQHDVCDAIISHARTHTHDRSSDERIEIDKFDIDFINEKWIRMRNGKRAIASSNRLIANGGRGVSKSIHKIVLHIHRLLGPSIDGHRRNESEMNSREGKKEIARCSAREARTACIACCN